MKKALSQAKILAIDKNKGRVTLATKNGLISTGTYLYDINDLRENMTVLVGKVSGTNVIIEKVSANPKNSNSMTMPVTYEYFILKLILTDELIVPLPLVSEGTYDFDIIWGDGFANHITSYDDPNAIHTYESPGTYFIKIKGLLRGWTNDPYPEFWFDADVTLTNWGSFDFTNYLTDDFVYPMFTDWRQLQITATDVPDLSTAEALAVFYSCKAIRTVPNLELWDVSGVKSLAFLFNGCTLFNQDISMWNVSNVINMGGLFSYAESFNQPLNSWDVSNVTNMSLLFLEAKIFNQPLNSWDVSKVTSMYSLFAYAEAFNQPLNSWDVSSVNFMLWTFAYAKIFNQPLSNWDVSNVTSMHHMFDHAESFNQPLNSWDVSNVIYMNGMFAHAYVFNQPLDNWNVSNVTNMSMMFSEAYTFNQDISMWDISSVTTMENMFKNSAFSTENYEKLLVGWSAQNVKWNVRFHAGSAQYHAAYAPYKQILLDKGWIITDGGQI
jgi:surface protein